jgi:hypothetical protein
MDISTDISNMFFWQSWAAANERHGYNDDAASDRENMYVHYNSIKDSGQMTLELVNNIYYMGYCASWYTANTVYGYESGYDEEQCMNQYYETMYGHYELIAMNFFPEQSIILKEEKKIISQQILINNGDIEQSMGFDFVVDQGSTSQTSHNLTFDFDIDGELRAHFLWLVRIYFSVDFKISVSRGFSESLQTGILKRYSFPLTVPAGKSYIAEASIQEGTMEVPYELIFLCDGVEQKLNGLWEGVAVSTAVYEINECGPREC